MGTTGPRYRSLVLADNKIVEGSSLALAHPFRMEGPAGYIQLGAPIFPPQQVGLEKIHGEDPDTVLRTLTEIYPQNLQGFFVKQPRKPFPPSSAESKLFKRHLEVPLGTSYSDIIEKHRPTGENVPPVGRHEIGLIPQWDRNFVKAEDRFSKFLGLDLIPRSTRDHPQGFISGFSNFEKVRDVAKHEAGHAAAFRPDRYHATGPDKENPFGFKATGEKTVLRDYEEYLISLMQWVGNTSESEREDMENTMEYLYGTGAEEMAANLIPGAPYRRRLEAWFNEASAKLKSENRPILYEPGTIDKIIGERIAEGAIDDIKLGEVLKNQYMEQFPRRFDRRKNLSGYFPPPEPAPEPTETSPTLYRALKEVTGLD